MGEVFTVLQDLPCGLRGCTHANRDGSYTILINARLSFMQQREVFLHEIGHICGDDFCKNDVDEIETAAHSQEGIYPIGLI